MNARLAIGQRADLFEANISANKINLPQGHSYTEKECYDGSSMYQYSFPVKLWPLKKANFVSRNIGLR